MISGTLNICRCNRLMLSVLMLAAGAAVAAYPERPIRMIIAATAGSGPDILARQIGNQFTEAWGQQVVVDARPGATGLVGAEIVSKSAADGYTLWFATMTQLIGTTLYQRHLMARDFAPVGMVASTAFAIAANAALPVTTIPELIAYAKARPGQLLYGSSGQGSTAHLCMEMFRSLTGIEVVHVPYRGAVPAITDLMAGHIQISCQAVPALPNYLKSGRIRSLGVTTLTRTVIAPDVPPIADTLPGFEILGWYGILAPLHTPKDIITKINAAVVHALKSTEMQEKLITLGAEAAGSTPAEFSAFLQKETTRWTKLLREANIRPTE
jgi:tripartite-type tricarboxylate transporter receptor subunit TctC